MKYRVYLEGHHGYKEFLKKKDLRLWFESFLTNNRVMQGFKVIKSEI